MGGVHRSQEEFSRAKWKKRLLLPVWLVQVGLLMGLLGVFAYRVSDAVATWEQEEMTQKIPLLEFVWECINVGFSFISLIITLYSIAKFVAESLTPTSLLVTSLMSLTLAVVILALDIVIVVKHSALQHVAIGIALESVLILFTIVPAAYSIVAYRRLSADQSYHVPGNVKSYGYDAPRDTAYNGASATTGGGRNRSLSAVSAMSARLSLSSRAQSPEPTEIELEQPRRGSYDHRRDTSFDAYVSRRTAEYSPERVHQEMRAQYGWTPEDKVFKNEQHPDVMVPGGSMASVTRARPRAGSLERQQPATHYNRHLEGAANSEFGGANIVITPPPQEVVLGRSHSLRNVPEEDVTEDDDDVNHPNSKSAAAWKYGGRRPRALSEDKQRLISYDSTSTTTTNSSRKPSPAPEGLAALFSNNNSKHSSSSGDATSSLPSQPLPSHPPSLFSPSTVSVGGSSPRNSDEISDYSYYAEYVDDIDHNNSNGGLQRGNSSNRKRVWES